MRRHFVSPQHGKCVLCLCSQLLANQRGCLLQPGLRSSTLISSVGDPFTKTVCSKFSQTWNPTCVWKFAIVACCISCIFTCHIEKLSGKLVNQGLKVTFFLQSWLTWPVTFMMHFRNMFGNSLTWFAKVHSSLWGAASAGWGWLQGRPTLLIQGPWELWDGSMLRIKAMIEDFYVSPMFNTTALLWVFLLFCTSLVVICSQALPWHLKKKAKVHESRSPFFAWTAFFLHPEHILCYNAKLFT